ncbi:MAG: DUF4956 domain-containing protein [Bacteroidales bacterium]
MILNTLLLKAAKDPSVWEVIESVKFLDIRLIDFEDLAELLFRFLVNTFFLFIIVRNVYLKHSTRRTFTFSYIAMGTLVFLLCFLLNNVKLELGFALGLFAIFGIIRYRTDAIPFKQMTYLFVIIGISVMNALANKKVSYAELLFTNLAIFAGLWLLERYLSFKQEGSMKIVYENISNIHHDKYDLLMADLKVRTGFEIKHFEIENIDYLKDTANITIYFNTSDNSYYVDEENKL